MLWATRVHRPLKNRPSDHLRLLRRVERRLLRRCFRIGGLPPPPRPPPRLPPLPRPPLGRFFFGLSKSETLVSSSITVLLSKRRSARSLRVAAMQYPPKLT